MDTIQWPGKTAPAIIAGVALFLVLMITNGVVRGVADSRTDPQKYYDSLALALHNDGLLPPVGEDVFIMHLAGLSLKPEYIKLPGGNLIQGRRIGLGKAVSGFTHNSNIDTIEVQPDEYRLLRPGALRNALRELAKKKPEQLLPLFSSPQSSTNQSAEFIVCPAGKYFKMYPVIKASQLDKIIISE